MKKIILITGITTIFLIGCCVAFLQTKNQGALEISVSPQDAIITADGKTLGSGSQNIKPGAYRIIFSKEGYVSQSKDVVISKGKTLKLSVRLLKNTDNTILQTIKDYSSSSYFEILEKNNLRVIDYKSFYEGAWVVATVQANSDPGIVVLQKDSQSDDYTIAMGPGTSFDIDTINQLPSDVSSNLKQLMGF